ncbi:hypothetical protein MRBLMR1_004985 [Neorhizobium sp. LMR1-1-1.1]
MDYLLVVQVLVRISLACVEISRHHPRVIQRRINVAIDAFDQHELIEIEAIRPKPEHGARAGSGCANMTVLGLIGTA